MLPFECDPRKETNGQYLVSFPHPDKPNEAIEILDALRKLMLCHKAGRWELTALDKWLDMYPENIAQAAERLDSFLDTIYPPTEVPYERTST